MPPTKKELILKSFQQMDLSMLEVLLDENKTYQNASKTVFLEKLNEVFEEFKENSDTHLLAEKGVCSSTHCDQKGCWGYSFSGNASRKCINLIFEESEDDVNDIYNCRCFRTDNEPTTELREYTELNDKGKSPIYIDIKRDEQADFKPSVDFLIKSQAHRLAYEELIQFRNTIINKDVYLPWLEEYHKFYETLDFYSYSSYTDYSNFFWLYNRVEILASFLTNETSIRQATKEFRNLDENEEIQVLKWLSKYEKIGYGLVAFLYEENMGREDFLDKREYFKVDILKIEPSDFKHIIAFKDLFDKYYWEMLEKYQTISSQDLKDLEQKYIESIREEHIRDSRKWYENYKKQYPEFPRSEPMIPTEEAFVDFLRNCSNFEYKYLHRYCHEDFQLYGEYHRELTDKEQSLTYHLKQRGLI